MGHRNAQRGERLLELGTRHAGFDVHNQAGLIDFQDAVHPGQVEGDAAKKSERPTLGAGPTASRHDRDPMVTRDPNDLCYLVGASRPDHHIGRRQLDAMELVELGHPGPVGGLSVEFISVDRRVLGADDIRQLMLKHPDPVVGSRLRHGRERIRSWR